MSGGLLALLGDRQVFCEDEARPSDPWIYGDVCAITGFRPRLPAQACSLEGNHSFSGQGQPEDLTFTQAQSDTYIMQSDSRTTST